MSKLALIFGFFCVAADKRGFMFFSSSDSDRLYYFPGDRWRALETPRWVISVATDTDGKIWAGTRKGIGFIDQSTSGEMEFVDFPIDVESRDDTAFIIGFAMPWGVRFGNSRTVVDIDTTKSPPTATVHRCGEGESFVGGASASLFTAVRGEQGLLPMARWSQRNCRSSSLMKPCR